MFEFDKRKWEDEQRYREFEMKKWETERQESHQKWEAERQESTRRWEAEREDRKAEFDLKKNEAAKQDSSVGKSKIFSDAMRTSAIRMSDDPINGYCVFHERRIVV